MDSQTLREIHELALSGTGITEPQALRIAGSGREELFDLFGLSNRTRQEFKNSKVKLCAIVNAKSGSCSENCAFCAQSSHHKTDSKKFSFITKTRLLSAAKKAAKDGSKEFSIVTSGKSLEKKDLKKVVEILPEIKSLGLSTCASIGVLGPDALKELAQAGLDKYHHNLETSRSYFPKICTTHEYDEDIETVKSAAEAGMPVCCGGIFGLGESRRDWIELASTLRELNVDSIPLNFHIPVKGTRLGEAPLLPALDALRIIVLFRLMMPTKDIIICGGREVILRDLQCLVFPAGANGLMLGDYLTTKGREPGMDLKMLEDLEFSTTD